MTPATAASQGFTLVELMVTLLVAAIIVAASVPTFREFVLRNRMAASTNELITALALARSEAIKRGVQVAVCGRAAGAETCVAGNWGNGWLVFADADGNGKVDGDDELLRAQGPLPESMTLLASGLADNRIVYLPTGFPPQPFVAGGASEVRLQLCHVPGSGAPPCNDILINSTGRVRCARAGESCS
ncbi:MAG: GspH/FimT family pseudopilin [Betaproteobacteria bacterium]|nr:GspH/FimT family pseudopilin [Betaproteobacteria bacterium]